jgi:hypothetical protein
MAIFRKIHTSFWSDSFIQDLDKDQKLFYLYLLTNERTRQCGVYEITLKQISYDLGYSIDKVSVLLKYFIKVGKIRYNESTKELAIGKWLKYNYSSSPKVKKCIDTEFKYCKDTVLIDYVKSMETLSQEEQEEEKEEEQIIEIESCYNFNQFWDDYGKKVDTSKCKEKYLKLSETERQILKYKLPIYIQSTSDIKFRKNPLTYLNGKCWLDDVKEPEREETEREYNLRMWNEKRGL